MLSGDAQGVIHSGILKKSPPEDQMRKRRSWRDRFFTLYRKTTGAIHLRYYRTNKSKQAENEMKGFIDMATCLTLESGHTLKGFEKMFSFSIVTPRRTYFLLSKKESDMREWVQKVCESCGFAATSSISPDTIRTQLTHSRMNASGSHGDLAQDGEYNDAFQENGDHSKSSVPNLYAEDPAVRRAKGDMSVTLANQMKGCSLTPYESLSSPNEEYGQERQYNSHAGAEYSDQNTYGMLSAATYGTLNGTSITSPGRRATTGETYGVLKDQTYASCVDDLSMKQRAAMNEYGAYGPIDFTKDKPLLKAALTPQKSPIGAPDVVDNLQSPVSGLPVKAKPEHYLNLLPDRPQLDSGRSSSTRNGVASNDGGVQRPPPVDRSVKPCGASVALSSPSQRSSSEFRRKGPPGGLSFTQGGQKSRQLMNDVYSHVPLSPVTSFCKKREDLNVFFTEHTGDSLLETPPSPSRISHDSFNSSNSASDPESVSNNLGYQQARVSSSLPASAATSSSSNSLKFKWSQQRAQEINYTELAPDSPAHDKVPMQGLGSNATTFFSFSSCANVGNPDNTSSPANPNPNAKLQSSRSLDNNNKNSNSAMSTPTAEVRRRMDIEYTQVDPHKTKIINKMMDEREEELEERKRLRPGHKGSFH